MADNVAALERVLAKFARPPTLRVGPSPWPTTATRAGSGPLAYRTAAQRLTFARQDPRSGGLPLQRGGGGLVGMAARLGGDKSGGTEGAAGAEVALGKALLAVALAQLLRGGTLPDRGQSLRVQITQYVARVIIAAFEDPMRRMPSAIINTGSTVETIAIHAESVQICSDCLSAVMLCASVK